MLICYSHCRVWETSNLCCTLRVAGIKDTILQVAQILSAGGCRFRQAKATRQFLCFSYRRGRLFNAGLMVTPNP
jgi:hypothetical protein